MFFMLGISTTRVCNIKSTTQNTNTNIPRSITIFNNQIKSFAGLCVSSLICHLQEVCQGSFFFVNIYYYSRYRALLKGLHIQSSTAILTFEKQPTYAINNCNTIMNTVMVSYFELHNISILITLISVLILSFNININYTNPFIKSQ